jgi:phytoene/squalene synthetase
MNKHSVWPLVRLVGAVLVLVMLVSTLFKGASSNNASLRELRELQQQVKLLQDIVVGGRHLGQSPAPRASKERARVEVRQLQIT